MNVTMVGRTVSVVKDFTTETAKNGNEYSYIMYSFAVNRGYRDSDNKPITDFWLVKATGKTAELLNEHCNGIKENGKHESRHLALTGSFETYKKKITENRDLILEVDGESIDANCDFEYETVQTVFVVQNVDFLDSKSTTSTTTQPTIKAKGTRKKATSAKVKDSGEDKSVPTEETDSIDQAIENIKNVTNSEPVETQKQANLETDKLVVEDSEDAPF